ncbi:MAG: SpoIID/LytB domain-containing protein [Nannocystaceae bacterium]
MNSPTLTGFVPSVLFVCGVFATPTATAQETLQGSERGPFSGFPGPVLTGPQLPGTEVVAPIPGAHCETHIVDIGVDTWVSTELDYLPHVVQCENGGANLEALKAQAIAARSVVYYAMETSGEICDSQGCQVYSCDATPNELQRQAVEETAGMYMMYNDTLTYGFYVAGDSTVQPPLCIGDDNNAGTEKFVTYNGGKTGEDVSQTTLGFIFDPGDFGYGQNRGCMGQWAARCLENNNGATYLDILKYFYGDDIEIVTAEGACIPDGKVQPAGTFDGVNCDRVEGWAHDPDAPGQPIEVQLAFDGAPEDPDATVIEVLADGYRDDLCDLLMSCEHGFSLPSPLSLHDGVSHPIHAYAKDPEGEENIQLSASPRALNCPLELPDGVRRLVSPESSTAWSFTDFWSLLPATDAMVASLEDGPAVPEEPWLVRAEGESDVWMMDASFRRLVLGPNTMSAWSLNSDNVEVWSIEQVLAVPIGPELRPRPVLVRDSLSGATYLIDSPFPEDMSETGPVDPDSDSDTETTGNESSTGGVSTGDSSLPPSSEDSDTSPADDESGCGCRVNDSEPLQWLSLPLLVLLWRRWRHV